MVWRNMWRVFVREFLKSAAIAIAGAFTLLAAGAANAAAIGTFSDIPVYNTQLVTVLNDQGHTVNSLAGGQLITASYLSGLDVFITGLIPANATAGELAALTDWVMAGGTLVITGEHSGFKDRYNTWLNSFGVTLDGVSWNYNTPVVFATDPTDPYLANGVSGSTMPISNRGWYSAYPSDANILATGTDGTVFALQLDLGAGVVIAVADTYFLNNGVVNDPGNGGMKLLSNAISLAGATQPGGGGDTGGEIPSEIPLPGGLLLMASALGLAGAGRAKRKLALA